MLRGGQGIVGNHYQSIGNLPTLNEVNELNLFRNYRSGERLYDTSIRPFPGDVGNVGDENDENPIRPSLLPRERHRPDPILQSSSDDTYQMIGTNSIYVSNNISANESSSSRLANDRDGAPRQWRNRANNSRTRISPAVRRRRQILNRRSNDDSYIGRGTRYLRTFNEMRS